MEPTVVSLPWGEVLKLALGAGVVATIVSQFAEWLKEHWRSKSTTERDATYLAARIAVILEQFAIRCAEAIADNQMLRTSGGYAGASHISLPSLGDYPIDADWKALEPTLMTQSLSLPNELLLADRVISFWAEVDPDPHLLRGACDEQAGKCGYRAWRLAERLRIRYKMLDSADPNYVVSTLKKHHDRALDRIEKEREDDRKEKAAGSTN